MYLILSSLRIQYISMNFNLGLQVNELLVLSTISRPRVTAIAISTSRYRGYGPMTVSLLPGSRDS